MGLSVASLNPIRSVAYVTPQQKSYSIDSESAISSAYRESLGNTATPEGVRGPSPVMYSNTQYNVSSVDSLSASQRMNRAYNALASSFGGVDTMYDSTGTSSAYGAVGQYVDAFA